MSRTFLLLNGSLHGESGNTTILLAQAANLLGPQGVVRTVNLSTPPPLEEIESLLRESSALVIGTGTYWDSWGSPLQTFFEQVSHTEGTDCWLGKPAATIVTMHSVGGKGVLSRLQGVLNTFGALIPPMGGLVYSAVAHAALGNGDSEINDDLWRPSDLEVICHNLVECCRHASQWSSWSVDRRNFHARWLGSKVDGV